MRLTTTQSPETRLRTLLLFRRNKGGCRRLIMQNNLGLRHHTGHRYRGRGTAHSQSFEVYAFLDWSVGGEFAGFFMQNEPRKQRQAQEQTAWVMLRIFRIYNAQRRTESG